MSDYTTGFLVGWLSAMIGHWLAGVAERRWMKSRASGTGKGGAR